MNRHERRAMARLAETVEHQRVGPNGHDPHGACRAELLAMLSAFEDAATETLVRQGARLVVLETLLEQVGVLTPERWQAALDHVTTQAVAPPEPPVVG